MSIVSVNIREKIEEAEMVLVGLGEEFQCPACVKKLPEYEKGKEIIQAAEMRWLLPAWDDYCERRAKADTGEILEKFADILAEKKLFYCFCSYERFYISNTMERRQAGDALWGTMKLQCTGECDREPVWLSTEDRHLLEEVMDDLYEGKFSPEKVEQFGKCENCQKSMVLNNIYTEIYNERGYLEQWNLYTKWLQGTLNHRVLILELGVGMRFPTVIRFPFEKVAFFNQKAELYRINENLYHMTEELKGKGQGISQNAIDCLRNL